MTGLAMLAVAAAVVLGGFAVLARRLTSKELAMVASVAALAAAGRIVFAAIPSVQPVTVMVLLTGFVFGTAAGFVTGATTAFVSNLFLGQGPWTIWQMLAWGWSAWSAGSRPSCARRPGPRRWWRFRRRAA